jgi:DNA repair exonuclease SbcCD ATPase subunit
MTIAKERPRSAMAAEPISVITNATLLARRIRELQRRRRAIAEQQEQLRTQLPDWAAEPLRLIGMTNDEIQGLVADLSTVEAEAGLDEVEQRMDEIDRQIEELESLLASTPSGSLDEIEAIASVAVNRFREMVVTDPNDVFYDHGECRLLGLIERIHEDLSGLVSHSRLDAS